MFHSVQRLVSDIRLVLMSMGKEGSSETTDVAGPRSREAILRVVAQLLITALALSACASIVMKPNASLEVINLAHIGFGIIIGYWLR